MKIDQWISVTEALLELEAKGAILPHGIGGHARALLEDALGFMRLQTNTDQTVSTERLAQDVLMAVLDCPHTIEGDKIVLRAATAGGGNATAQLHKRIADALASRTQEPAEAVDAGAVVDELFSDLRDRRFLKWLFKDEEGIIGDFPALRSLDLDVQQEIRNSWEKIISRALSTRESEIQSLRDYISETPPAPERSKEEVGVKPLEWKPFPSDEDVSFMFAAAFGVRYEVFHKASDVAKIGIQVARMQHVDGLLNDDDDGEETTTIIGYGKDLVAACAIAQSDFDALVLSALEPAPLPVTMDRADYRKVAEQAYWLLAWTWQSHLFRVGEPFDMTIFAPEARDMMNKGEQDLFDALSALEPASPALFRVTVKTDEGTMPLEDWQSPPYLDQLEEARKINSRLAEVLDSLAKMPPRRL